MEPNYSWVLFLNQRWVTSLLSMLPVFSYVNTGQKQQAVINIIARIVSNSVQAV